VALVLCFVISACLVQGQQMSLSLEPVQGIQGCSTTVGIVLSASPDPRPSGLEWTISCPPDDILAIDFKAGPSASAAGKTIQCAYGPGYATCLVLGMNTEPIAAGVLAIGTLHVGPGAQVGIANLQLPMVMAVSKDAAEIPMNAIAGSVAIGSALKPGPVFETAGVVNAASLAAGPIAPGELISIFGCSLGSPVGLGATLSTPETLSGNLSGTRVLFDGIEAPLIFVRNDQVNVVAPFEIYGKTQTALQVEYQGQLSTAALVSVSQASPALFTLDSSGKGNGAIVNDDLTLNSPLKPAPRGSTISLYGNGGGQTDPAGISGHLCVGVPTKPLLPVSVSIGNLPAEIAYSGCAPTSVEGLLQVNVRIPEGVGSGPQPLILAIGDQVSPANVTVSVE